MTVIRTHTSVNQGADYKTDVYKDTDTGATTQIVALGRLSGGEIVPYEDDAPIPTAPILEKVYQNGNLLTVKRAVVGTSSSGDTTIVSAVANKRIVVVSARILVNGPVNLKFRSNSTDLEGPAYCTTDSGYVLNFNQAGWLATVAGEALKLNLSDAIAVGGNLQYVEAD